MRFIHAFIINSGRRAMRLKRHGSLMQRYSHSAFILCHAFGARMTVPAKTSSEPPRPAIRPTSNRSAFCAIQSSCFGAPRQTMRKSGCAAFIFSITGSSSLKYPSFVPQTLSPGYVSCIFSFAASATPALRRAGTRFYPSARHTQVLPRLSQCPADAL